MITLSLCDQPISVHYLGRHSEWKTSFGEVSFRLQVLAPISVFLSCSALMPFNLSSSPIADLHDSSYLTPATQNIFPASCFYLFKHQPTNQPLFPPIHSWQLRPLITNFHLEFFQILFTIPLPSFCFSFSLSRVQTIQFFVVAYVSETKST